MTGGAFGTLIGECAPLPMITIASFTVFLLIKLGSQHAMLRLVCLICCIALSGFVIVL
jgi:hypothetical protein